MVRFSSLLRGEGSKLYNGYHLRNAIEASPYFLMRYFLEALGLMPFSSMVSWLYAFMSGIGEGTQAPSLLRMVL